MATPKKSSNTTTTGSYLGRIESEIQSNQSRLNMILGALIVLVVGILVFNYFNKGKADLGPAQSTTSKQQQQEVAPSNLPGRYTVKDGDSLFDIANTYYNDGYKYTVIAKTNDLTNPDVIETGQVLEIPKMDSSATMATVSPSESPVSTDWGPKITENTYIVQAGDWLSTIAGRAYEDIYAYNKIAAANNISNPNNIEVGTKLTIPR